MRLNSKVYILFWRFQVAAAVGGQGAPLGTFSLPRLWSLVFGQPLTLIHIPLSASGFLKLDWWGYYWFPAFLPLSVVSNFGSVLSPTSVSGMADVRHSEWTQDTGKEYLNSVFTEGYEGTPCTVGAKPKGWQPKVGAEGRRVYFLLRNRRNLKAFMGKGKDF